MYICTYMNALCMKRYGDGKRDGDEIKKMALCCCASWEENRPQLLQCHALYYIKYFSLSLPPFNKGKKQLLLFPLLSHIQCAETRSNIRPISHSDTLLHQWDNKTFPLIAANEKTFPVKVNAPIQTQWKEAAAARATISFQPSKYQSQVSASSHSALYFLKLNISGREGETEERKGSKRHWSGNDFLLTNYAWKMGRRDILSRAETKTKSRRDVKFK